MAGWTLALTYARREMRGGLRGFRIFLACLALGVAAIAAVGGVSAAFTGGLRADGRSLLGGDLSLRLSHRGASPEQLAFIDARAEAVTTTVEMRAMVRPADPDARRSLVELKAVEASYPLAGVLTLKDSGELHGRLARNNSLWGAVADGGLMERLRINVGDTVKLGEAEFQIRGVIEKEPDRVASVFSFGPRFMIARDALPGTGLVQPGSQIRYYHKAVLAPGALDPVVQGLLETFPDAGWQLRTAEEAAPGVRRFVDRLTLFLTFAGLTVLLVGGVGVTNAVKSYLDGKTATIATLKCLGAPSGLIFKIYLLQILGLAVAAVSLGLIIGTLLPWAGLGAVAGKLPVAPRAGIYWQPMAAAAGFGLTTALTFALWPLAKTRNVRPQALFRNLIAADSGGRAQKGDWLLLGLGAAALAALTIGTATDPRFAAWYAAGAAGTLLLLGVSAGAVMSAARRIKQPPSALWRLVLANMTRPGSSVPSVVLSLGLGLTALVAVGQIEANMTRQVNDRLPENAPAFFFLDIQPDQAARFDEIVTGVEGAGGFRRAPALRGRITEINGAPADQADVRPDARWALRGDRGLTYTREIPEGTRLVAGEWWPEDYSGRPLVSLDADIAAGFGVDLGDTLTVDVLGVPVTATIASLREINWSSLRFDFVMLFSPGVLEGAPHTHVAAVEAPEELEETIERQVSDAFANVSSIRVREALEAAARILAGIGWTVTGTALITIAAGALVLAGAIAAGHHRRVYDAVVFKVLGARRARIARTFLMEYGLLGAVTGLIGGLLGTAAAWAVVSQVMDGDWLFDGPTAVRTVLICLAVTLSAGFIGAWRALGEKAAPHLRNE